MCIIVDINVAHRVFRRDDPDFGPVHEALFGSSARVSAKLVYGGRLRREYLKSDSIRRVLIQLDRAGRSIAVPDDPVDEEENRLIQTQCCTSDDQHIIALARTFGPRLLCSHDRDLHLDFTNPRLVNSPRGKVYQTRTHTRLLRQQCNGK